MEKIITVSRTGVVKIKIDHLLKSKPKVLHIDRVIKRQQLFDKERLRVVVHQIEKIIVEGKKKRSRRKIRKRIE